MTEDDDMSCHSNHSLLEDLFERSLHRFLDEPGHLSALEIVLNDSAYYLSQRSSDGSLLLVEDSEAPSIAQEETVTKEMEEEINKLREEKRQLERDLKAKKDRKRAQKKKKKERSRQSSDQEVSTLFKTEEYVQEMSSKKSKGNNMDQEMSTLLNKHESVQETSLKKSKGNNMDQEKSPQKTKDDLDQEVSPMKSKGNNMEQMISPKKTKDITDQEKFPKKSKGNYMYQEKSPMKIKDDLNKSKDGSLKQSQSHSDLRSLEEVPRERRRHSVHETPTQTGAVKEKKSKQPSLSVVEKSNPIQGKTRQSAYAVTGKSPPILETCPIQEILIVSKSKRTQSQLEVPLKEQVTKSKETKGNDKHCKKEKQVRKETSKQEATTATTIKEQKLTKAELNARREREALAKQEAALKRKEERLKLFEKERCQSASPRIKSRKMLGTANKPPPKCILDALRWATRKGLFGVNHDQTRRARMIAAHRREKFEQLVSEYDKGVAFRRHSASS